MIITRLDISAFAGLADRELGLAPGLNVILGPNEAGKSTSFTAVQKALLTPSQLNCRAFQAEIEKFIPLGGDTAQVELHFRHGGEPYVLKKSWGGTALAELKLPGGQLLTGDEAVSEQLLSLLPARAGTMKTVLMTYQSGLEKTLADLEDDPEAVHSLNDLLRRSVMEADGISVEEFRREVQERRDGYFSRWDSLTGGPEGGRGIHNPWSRGVGKILEAYYEKEKADSKLEQAQEIEGELDCISSEISSLAAVIEAKEAFIGENEKIVAEVRARGTLEAEGGRLDLSITNMKKANSAWPVLLSEIGRIDAELPGIEAHLEDLEEEKKQALAAEAGRQVKERFARVGKKKEAVAEAGEELDRTPRLTAADLQAIREASDSLGSIRTSISAGQLAAKLTAKNALKVTVTRDMDASEAIDLKKGGELPIEAGGRIAVEHADWSIEVTSGEIDFAGLKAKCQEAETELEGLFEQHGVGSLEETIRINSAYEAAAARLEQAESGLEEELEGETYEALAARVKELGEAGSGRSEAEVVEDIANLKNDIGRKSDVRAAKQAEVDVLEEEYGASEDLLLRLGEEVSARKALDQKLGSLATLPDGYESAEEFITGFEAAKQEREDARSRKNGLDIEKAGLPAIDESSEELQLLLQDARERFEATLKQGEAVARIADRTEQILAEADDGLFAQLESDLERYVATITDGRYREVAMEEGLPQGFERADGEIVLYELLSHGTRDVLSLALRLSMASRFLSGTDGFLAMDDPLVNLDPERQQKAAAILKEYAENQQVLVFTCHPSHAGLLGGNLVQMEGKDLSGAKAGV